MGRNLVVCDYALRPFWVHASGNMRGGWSIRWQIDLSSSNENIRKKNLKFSTKKECFLEESGLANSVAVFCIFASWPTQAAMQFFYTF